MFKKLFTISLVLILVGSFLNAQDRQVLRPNGDRITLPNGLSLKDALDAREVKNSKGVSQHTFHKSMGQRLNLTTAGTIDTLNNDQGNPWSTFGMYSGDVMLTWFEAPATMTIKAVGISAVETSLPEEAMNMEVRLLKFNWSADDLWAVDAPQVMGTYPDPDNTYYPYDPTGVLNGEPFGENTGNDWVDLSEGMYPTPPWAHDDYDLWSDGTFGWPIAPTGVGYDWVEMINLGVEPELQQGEVFAIVVTHASILYEQPDADYLGFNSDGGNTKASWKFYNQPRLATETSANWWARHYSWDFVAIVDLTGDRAPVISDVTVLTTNPTMEARDVSATIIDDNPSGGDFGVESANIMYTLDGGDPQAAAMTASGDVYSGAVPGQPGGTIVTYWVEATDVLENSSVSAAKTYEVFAVTTDNCLVIWNGGSASGYPGGYYWGDGSYIDPETTDPYAQVNFPHDDWELGAGVELVIDSYRNVIEIATNGPNVDFQAVIRAWLEADGTRNYCVWGDEYLGGYYEWPADPLDIPDGDFAKDILGIATYYADGMCTTGDTSTVLNPVDGSTLGTDQLTAYNDQSPTSPLIFDPIGEGVLASNWADKVDFVEDVEVFVTGVDAPTGNEGSMGGSRILANGNKVVFMGYDPLPVTSSGDDPYYWYGFLPSSPHSEALFEFFGIVVGVDDVIPVPGIYALAQNYPNPFNPSTKIAFSVPSQGNVTLKVFNMLGQEVATLLNEVRNAGVHEVAFDGINLSSGVYFYTLSSGDFVSTKKMMLLK